MSHTPANDPYYPDEIWKDSPLPTDDSVSESFDELETEETVREMADEADVSKEYIRQAINFKKSDTAYHRHNATPTESSRPSSRTILAGIQETLFFSSYYTPHIGAVTGYFPDNNTLSLTVTAVNDPQNRTTKISFDYEDPDSMRSLNRLLNYLSLSKPSDLADAHIPVQVDSEAIFLDPIEVHFPPEKPLSRLKYHHGRAVNKYNMRHPNGQLDFNRRYSLGMGAPPTALGTVLFSLFSGSTQTIALLIQCLGLAITIFGAMFLLIYLGAVCQSTKDALSNAFFD